MFYLLFIKLLLKLIIFIKNKFMSEENDCKLILIIVKILLLNK